MWRLLFVLIAVIASALAQRTIHSTGPCDLHCRQTVDKGHIIHLTMGGDLEVFDREGLRLFEAVVLSPASTKVISSTSAAIDTDETVAVTAVWEESQGQAGGVVLFDRKGKHIRTIETGRFLPEHVTFDSNHYIWTYGRQAGAEDRAIEDRQDYTLVRKVSREGAEEGRMLWRSSFPGWTGGVRVFRAAQDRIGMLVEPARPPGEAYWMEVDFKGKRLGNWRVGKPAWFNIAYLPDGSLFTIERNAESGEARLVEFDRDSAEWQWVKDLEHNTGNDGLDYGTLLGCDDDQLIFLDTIHQKLIWLPLE